MSSSMQHQPEEIQCGRTLEVRLTLWKGGQGGSCVFNSCIEKGISVGLICIYGEPGEIPSSSQHLKLQEPCPHLNLVTLVELLQL